MPLIDIIYLNTFFNSSSRSSPRRSCAIIFPAGSIRKFLGILCTLYNLATALFQNLRSDNCVHPPKRSALIAFNQENIAPGLSNDTPTIVKFLFLYLLYVLTTFGFSWRQGPHQDAQKSSNTYFPLNDERRTACPKVSVCSK